LASSWSCRSGVWVCSCIPATTLDSRDESLTRFVQQSLDDRYVSITSYKLGDSGIYDAQTNAKVREEEQDSVEYLLMHARRKACNGYYTGLLGAVFLLDGQKYSSLLPPCEWRNLDNAALKNRAWFDRPCDDRSWRETPAASDANKAKADGRPEP
ncbi:hypothetical protein, partial [Paracoccus sp. AS002]